MTKFEGAVFFTQAGAITPKEYVERALKEYPSSIGVAAIVKLADGNTVGFQLYCTAATVSVEQFMLMQEKYKDCDRLVHLSKWNGKFSEDDMQPFVVITDEKDEEDIKVVACIEGDYMSKIDGKGRPDEAILIENYFIPKLQKLYKQSGGNLSNFFIELSDQTVEADFAAQAINRGTLVVFGVDGQIKRPGENNELFRRYDWGWTTKHLGYAAEELKVDTPAVNGNDGEVKMDMFGRPIVADTKSVAQKKETETTTIKQVGDTTVIEKKKITVRPTASIHGVKNALRKWYDRLVSSNNRPDNYYESPWIEVTVERLEDVKSRHAGFTYQVKDQPVPTSVPSVKPEDEKHKVPVDPDTSKPKETYKSLQDIDPSKVQTVERKPPQDMMPILTPEDCAKITARMAKIKDFQDDKGVVDHASQDMAIAPSKIGSLESQLPTFTQYLKTPKERWYNASYAALVELTRDYPDSMAVLTFNLLQSAKKMDPQQKQRQETSSSESPTANAALDMFGRPKKTAA